MRGVRGAEVHILSNGGTIEKAEEVDWLKRHILATALVGAAVLLAATAAYASSRLASPGPTASELPVVRTARPLVAAVPAASSPQSPAASAEGTTPTKPSSSPSAPSGGATISHPRKTSGASERGASTSPGGHEVVTPPVHDSDDSESDHHTNTNTSDSRSTTGHVSVLGSSRTSHDGGRAPGGDHPHSGHGGGD